MNIAAGQPVADAVRHAVNVIETRRRGGVAEWLHDLPARSALKLCNQRHVRAWLGKGHERALARHNPSLPLLSSADQEIVAAIERDGAYVTTLDALALCDSAEIMQVGGDLAARFAAEARARAAGGQEFIYVPSLMLLDAPVLFGWGLQDRLLDIAEAYLGLPPAYDGVCLNYTVADGREISTRKWHRDWEDRRMLKVAVYLHDVDEQGGPFQVIRRHDSAQHDRNGFNYDLADDAALAKRLGTDFMQAVLSCAGPRGTVIFTDTARFFHRGIPAVARDRAAIFYSYFAQRPRHPFLCERSGMPRAAIRQLADAMPDRQRDAALWQQRLPLPLRVIPPARL